VRCSQQLFSSTPFYGAGRGALSRALETPRRGRPSGFDGGNLVSLSGGKGASYSQIVVDARAVPGSARHAHAVISDQGSSLSTKKWRIDHSGPSLRGWCKFQCTVLSRRSSGWQTEHDLVASAAQRRADSMRNGSKHSAPEESRNASMCPARLREVAHSTPACQHKTTALCECGWEG
jgi:hypothetical protein